MFNLDETHDPHLESWVPSAKGHGNFPIQNLPLGVFNFGARGGSIGIAIGDAVLDLSKIADLLDADLQGAAAAASLNPYLSLSTEARHRLRRQVSGLLSNVAKRSAVEPSLVPASSLQALMPATIGDYTDFYVGIHHANNIGRQYRPDNPLLPNYRHIPIGYHGRASSVCVSGQPVVRPHGQSKGPDDDAPQFGPSRRLDYELEMGIWIAGTNNLGDPVPIDQAYERIAGLCLLNDWSARDIQGWEAQPLGPFLAKSFHTTVSPWLVTADALLPYRVPQPARTEGDPRPLPYLWSEADQSQGALNVTLEVHLLTARMRKDGQPTALLSRGSATNMYWTIAQLVAHHTSNGCNLRPGDLLGTGTISAPDRTGFGSLMEISEGGKRPLELPNGETRTFLQDGDEVILTGYAEADGRPRIGFGECRAVVLPTR